MKKLHYFTLVVILTVASVAHADDQDRGFVHPGGIHTQADFNYVRKQIVAGNTKVTAAFNALLTWANSNTVTGAGATEQIIRGSTNNTGNAAYRIQLAYRYALLWKLTGTTKYADIAIGILNGWAQTCTSVTGDTNAALASGLQGYEFAQVGELMRDYSGWSQEDFKKYQKWMLKVFYPGNVYFLYLRNGTNAGGYWSNWGLCNVLSLMSIGILCDDVYLYNSAIEFLKYDMAKTNTKIPSPYNGLASIDYTTSPYNTYSVINNDSSGNFRDNGYNEYFNNLVYALHEDDRGVDIYGDGTHWLGQMQEFGRDQGHCAMAVGLITDICKTAWSQGDDLWSWMNNRLAAGIECVALYNYDTSCTVPFTSYHWKEVSGGVVRGDWTQTEASSSSRGQYRPCWYRILSYYEGIQGMSMPYAEKMAESDTNALDAYSGVDHFGFTHLMDIRPAVERSMAPVHLEPYIGVDGVYSHVSSYTDLSKNKSLTLKVILPDTVSGGSFSWDMGVDSLAASSETSSLTVTPQISNIYRCIYTAENGVTSTQMFSVEVSGDCHTDSIKKYFYVSHPTITDYNGWKSDSVNTVIAGSTTTLSCQAGSNTGTFRYFTRDSDGNECDITTSTFTINTDTTVYVEYTNPGGGVSLDSVKFVVALEMLYSINGGDDMSGSAVTASTGETVVLKPSYPSPKSWLWSTGDTTQYITIKDIKEGGEYTVTMTNTKGVTQTDTYTITVYDLSLVNPGDTITYNNKKYVLGSNIIQNPTFDDGFNGWYDGTTTTLLNSSNWTINTDGGVDGNWLQATTHLGKATAGAIGTAWEINADSLYYFGFCTELQESFTDGEWQRVSVTNTPGTETLILMGGDTTQISLENDSRWHLNSLVYDNSQNGYKYLQCCFRWEESGALGFDHFVLAPLFELNTAGISLIENKDTTVDDAIYNLSGIRVSKADKPGVYITRGKKYIVK